MIYGYRYFTRVADQMKERLAWYKATIEVDLYFVNKDISFFDVTWVANREKAIFIRNFSTDATRSACSPLHSQIQSLTPSFSPFFLLYQASLRRFKFNMEPSSLSPARLQLLMRSCRKSKPCTLNCGDLRLEVSGILSMIMQSVLKRPQILI